MMERPQVETVPQDDPLTRRGLLSIAMTRKRGIIAIGRDLSGIFSAVLSLQNATNVRFWHIADIDADDEHVRFWG
jgi:hypothetical protein